MQSYGQRDEEDDLDKMVDDILKESPEKSRQQKDAPKEEPDYLVRTVSTISIIGTLGKGIVTINESQSKHISNSICRSCIARKFETGSYHSFQERTLIWWWAKLEAL